MKVAVTGASGFVGSHVVRELLERGHEVVATVRRTGENDIPHLIGFQKAHPGRLSFHKVDLASDSAQTDLTAAFQGCEGVIHTAAAVLLTAKDPQREIVDVAVNNTRVALQAALDAGIKHFVQTSSVAAIEKESDTVHKSELASARVITEEDWNTTATVNTSPYPLGKYLSEKEAHAFVLEGKGKGKMNLACVNPVAVLGPILHPSHLNTSPQIVRDIVAGTFPAIPELGFLVVDVRDVAKVHVLSLESLVSSPIDQTKVERYLCSAGHMWFMDMANCLRDLYPEAKITKRALWNPLMYAAALFDKRLTFHFLKTNLSRRVVADGSKVTKTFNFEYIPTDQSVKDTAATLNMGK